MSPTAGHAIVIGASSGLGCAIAARLTGAGWFVSSLARRPAPREAAQASLSCDLEQPGSLDRAVAAAVDARGAPALLVYSAGLATMGRTLEVPAAEARRCFELNFWGLDRAVRVAVPRMPAGRGRVLAVLSLAALRAFPHQAYYAASKAAAARYLEC